MQKNHYQEQLEKLNHLYPWLPKQTDPLTVCLKQTEQLCVDIENKIQTLKNNPFSYEKVDGKQVKKEHCALELKILKHSYQITTQYRHWIKRSLALLERFKIEAVKEEPLTISNQAYMFVSDIQNGLTIPPLSDEVMMQLFKEILLMNIPNRKQALFILADCLGEHYQEEKSPELFRILSCLKQYTQNQITRLPKNDEKRMLKDVKKIFRTYLKKDKEISTRDIKGIMVQRLCQKKETFVYLEQWAQKDPEVALSTDQNHRSIVFFLLEQMLNSCIEEVKQKGRTNISKEYFQKMLLQIMNQKQFSLSSTEQQKIEEFFLFGYQKIKSLSGPRSGSMLTFWKNWNKEEISKTITEEEVTSQLGNRAWDSKRGIERDAHIENAFFFADGNGVNQEQVYQIRGTEKGLYTFTIHTPDYTQLVGVGDVADFYLQNKIFGGSSLFPQESRCDVQFQIGERTPTIAYQFMIDFQGHIRNFRVVRGKVIPTDIVLGSDLQKSFSHLRPLEQDCMQLYYIFKNHHLLNLRNPQKGLALREAMLKTAETTIGNYTLSRKYPMVYQNSSKSHLQEYQVVLNQVGDLLGMLSKTDLNLFYKAIEEYLESPFYTYFDRKKMIDGTYRLPLFDSSYFTVINQRLLVSHMIDKEKLTFGRLKEYREELSSVVKNANQKSLKTMF